MTSLFKPEFVFDEKTMILSVRTPSLTEVHHAMVKAFARDVDGKMRENMSGEALALVIISVMFGIAWSIALSPLFQ